MNMSEKFTLSKEKTRSVFMCRKAEDFFTFRDLEDSCAQGVNINLENYYKCFEELFFPVICTKILLVKFNLTQQFQCVICPRIIENLFSYDPAKNYRSELPNVRRGPDILASCERSFEATTVHEAARFIIFLRLGVCSYRRIQIFDFQLLSKLLCREYFRASELCYSVGAMPATE